MQSYKDYTIAIEAPKQLADGNWQARAVIARDGHAVHHTTGDGRSDAEARASALAGAKQWIDRQG